MDGARFWNTRSFSDYTRSIDHGELPIAGSERWTSRMRLEEAFLVGLRQLDGIDVRKLFADLALVVPHAWFGRVRDLEEAGIVEFPDPVLRLTRRGWLVASGVAEELVWPDLLSTSEVIP
jgi:coproporphyrinogen III oxidase-like Fe-S oxidoreductase